MQRKGLIGIGRRPLFGGRKGDRASGEGGEQRESTVRREGERKAVCKGCCGSEIKSGNYLDQHDSSNTWTVPGAAEEIQSMLFTESTSTPTISSTPCSLAPQQSCESKMKRLMVVSQSQAMVTKVLPAYRDSQGPLAPLDL
ncbi:hypothetical protein F7725_018581, partial [Dissostichus mawsoni]